MPSYDVTLRMYAYPEPDFVETGRQHVVILARIDEDAQFFAGDRIEYGRMGEDGLRLVRPLYDKLAAKVLKAGATRDPRERLHFSAHGVDYAKVVQLEQFWAEFQQELADLGRQELEAQKQPAEKPRRGRRRRGRRDR